MGRLTCKIFCEIKVSFLCKEEITWDMTSPWHIRTWITRNYQKSIALMHKFLIGSRCSALLVDMPRMQSPGRDICISFVSSPPLSQSDHACCISPGTKDSWDVHSCHLHLCIFIFLYFLFFFVYCIISRTTWFCIPLIYISLIQQLKHFLQSCFSFRETKTWI